MYALLDRATDATCAWVSYTQLAADSQRVVVMRMMGLSGAWSVPRSETSDMMAEKLPAFTEAIVSGALAAWSGAHPERVMRATLEPISDTARDNRVRLARYGPRLPGLTPVPVRQDQWSEE